MGFKDFVDRYVISLGPSAPKGGEIDPTKVPLETGPQVSALDVPPVDEAKLAKAAGGDPSFDKVFLAAQILPPAHGFTIEKVGEMLRHPKLSGMAKEAKAAAVLVAMEAAGVKVESVITEAVRKDKALDVFERVQHEHAVALVKQKDEENAKLRAQIAANDKAAADIATQLEAWKKKKAAKEADLFEAVSHFTTANPITVETLPQPAAPAQAAAPAAKVKVTDLSQELGK
ncbi:MAG: hypothetical protein HY926_08105 [Elusimicrobia bacterium]|nr:hypothetical protein [Elusimicrobiota bacterium]